MEVKNYFATDSQGNVLGSAQVYLYLAGTTTLATGVQNINGAALANPFTSQINGLVQFKAPDGDYDLRVVKPGREFTIRIQCFDGVAYASMISGENGASIVTYRLDQEGSVVRTQLSKNSDSISAYDFGLVGDGSDESEKIRMFLAAAPLAGKSYLQTNKTYGFIGQLKLPDNLNIVTNGSTFRRLASASGYGILVGENVTFDELRLSTPGALNEGGYRFIGDNPTGGRVKFSSDSEDCGGSSAVNAVLLQREDGGILQNPCIGKIFTSNHAKPFRAIGVKGAKIGRITGNKYITGAYLVDVSESKFTGARFDMCSSLAVGGPGQNGLLMEATSDLATRDVEISNWVVIGAAEHGMRMGGQYQIDNVEWRNCTVRLSGSGSAPTGGSSFKVLGPNGRGIFHTNIRINGCTAEDSGQSSSGNNFNALAFAWVDGGEISNFISCKKVLSYASNGGIMLSHLRRVTISNPIVEFTRQGALRFFEEIGDTGVGMQDVSVIGGLLHRDDVFDVVTLEPKVCQFENVRVTGSIIRGGRAAVRAETPESGGSYSDVYLGFTYVDPTSTSGGPATTGSNEICYDITAPWYGTFGASGKDGSTYRDTTNGLVRIRKGGSWISLGDPVVASGTWIPELTNTTNVAASVTNSCQYMRAGSVVTVSGYVQVRPSAVGAVQLDVSLPVPSDFTGFSQASGLARTDSGDISGVVNANASLNTISLILAATGTTNRNIAFQATYRVQ